MAFEVETLKRRRDIWKLGIFLENVVHLQNWLGFKALNMEFVKMKQIISSYLLWMPV